MDNKQGTIIGLGCLAIGCLSYFLYQFHKDSNYYKGKGRQLEQICKKNEQSLFRIDYEQLKKSKKTIPVFIPKIDIFGYHLQQDTYRQYIRERMRGYYFWHEEDFQQSQTGGNFKIMDRFNNNKQVKVQINNCNIHNTLIKWSREKNIVFEENKKKESINESITLILDRSRAMALYGVIGYSISEQCFVLQPQFMVQASKAASDTVQRMLSLWNTKLYFSTFKKMAMGVIISIIAYLAIYRPTKSLWSRYKNKFSEVSKGEFQYFHNKSNFSANVSGGLMCELCKNNNVSIVYQCGHLAQCEECHANSLVKKCGFCEKPSKKFMKIFL